MGTKKNIASISHFSHLIIISSLTMPKLSFKLQRKMVTVALKAEMKWLGENPGVPKSFWPLIDLKRIAKSTFHGTRSINAAEEAVREEIKKLEAWLLE